MNRNFLLCSMFLLLFIIADPGFAQVGGGGGKGGGRVSKEVKFKRQLTGKIGHMSDLGGYYIYGTPEEYVIANQNSVRLDNADKTERNAANARILKYTDSAQLGE